MPQAVVIPTSLSRNGSCLSNLRGVFKPDGKAYDFAKPDRVFNSPPNIIREKTATGEWSSSIPWAYTTNSTEGDATLNYPELLSTTRSGTILFRMFIKYVETPQSEYLVFSNGNYSVDGYAIILTYSFDSILFENVYNVFFENMNDPTRDRIQLNSNPLTIDTWYQFSVSFETVTISALTTTKLLIYEGAKLSIYSGLSLMTAVNTPTAGISAFFGFYGSITDFVFLDTNLPFTDLAAFGQAPYL